ncbi:U5 small nuclear ribonucleoprotein 40 kDa protein-like protein [Leptotrombidium deliense]|uniref:U5 small nuclear ribonucleoprotein 40 kDa protein n=1 Tax=Leptotrombidium deliense TaxID=299467 RepID=A0A443SP22_9ACAR|nr:U5 small nuclear ribonucleoprotein 40 kDa protein-like protein [Leptotrombidium deliense]
MPINEFGKRTLEETALVAVPQKKSLIATPDAKKSILETPGPARTSSLSSPIMLLTGHQGEVYCAKFHPNGNTLASAGHDRLIYFWNTYGECENYSVVSGHKGSVLDLHFSVDGESLFTTSTDKTVVMWDSQTGARIKKFKGHNGIVNSCHTSRRGPNLVCSGGDDCHIKIWDTRKKGVIHSFKEKYPVLAVTFNENSDQVVIGGIENLVKVYDLRKNEILYTMMGHYDSVTGLSLSPDGSFVLSNAMDNSLCIWDIRPFASQERCVKTLQGHQHNFEKNLLRCSWSPDGTKVCAGSADRFVYIWDTHYRRILYKLPGHLGSVNEVVFHPREPIILSCSSDKQIYLGEIE